MAARITALVLLACLCGCAWAPSPKPSSPSKLEKTCAFAGNWVPCFIVDEAQQTQWSI